MEIITGQLSGHLVSVIIPTYNSEKFIHRTLRSAVNQTYSNLEIIVVDDCSSDRTTEIVDQLIAFDNRIKLIRLDANLGSPGAVRNYAIEHARGDYIALLDHDDVWLKNKIRAQLTHLIRNELDLVYSPLWQFSKFNPLLGLIYIRPKISGLVTFELLLSDNLIQSSSVLVSTKAVIASGKFNDTKEYRGIDDYDLWLRISQNRRIGQLNQIQGLYRVTKTAISQNQDMVKAVASMKDKYPELILPERKSLPARLTSKIRDYPCSLFNLLTSTAFGTFKRDR